MSQAQPFRILSLIFSLVEASYSYPSPAEPVD